MRRVCLIHWNEQEAASRLRELAAQGFPAVRLGPRQITIPQCTATQPEAFVIALSRLPTHGKETGIHLRSSAATRHIPLIFAGGAPDRVAGIRELLPDAHFTEWTAIAAALQRALREIPLSVVQPAPMMDRFRDRTAAQKLGIHPGFRVAVYGAPPNYPKVIGAVPADVEWIEEPSDACDVTLYFLSSLPEFEQALTSFRRLAASSRLWLLWRKSRKNQKTELNEQVIRSAAIAIGLVDYKVCSVDETWSALLFAVKQAR